MAKSDAQTVEKYLENLPEDRRSVVAHVRDLILQNLPEGYEESMNWGMISYQIPLETYPETYNGQPLGYLALAAQKNYYALYMMCVYQNPALMQYLEDAYQDAGLKLDMGKSCLRFKNLDQLHEKAIAKIVASTEPKEFISQYEQARKS